jgi:hypothetical protein
MALDLVPCLPIWQAQAATRRIRATSGGGVPASLAQGVTSPVVDLDRTDADGGAPDAYANAHGDEPTSATAAASPRAIAQNAGTVGSRSAGERPASGAGVSGRQPATTADAIDHSDQPRMRGFCLFGVIAPIATAASTLVLGGDPRARTLLWSGMALHVVCYSRTSASCRAWPSSAASWSSPRA